MRRRIYFFILILFLLWTSFTWYQHADQKFLELDKCPSCYGEQCDSFASDQLQFESYSKYKLFNKVFNLKNVFYSRIKDRLYVLKKLAHPDELTLFDIRLCEGIGWPTKCNSGEVIERLVTEYDQNITRIVEKNINFFKHSELIKCGHRRVLPYLFERFHKAQPHSHSMHHFLTLLAINGEPLMMQAFSHIETFPKYFGACGRVIVEEYVGKSLSDYYESSWTTRANLALQLLQMAEDFTENEIRLYLTDPSSDNFAVDKFGHLKLIDLENFILVDSTEANLVKLTHFNDGRGCMGCFSYDYSDLCEHFKADHNYFAVCKGLLSSRPFSSSLPGGLLHSIPDKVIDTIPDLRTLIEECALPKTHGNRFEPARNLAKALETALQT